MINLRLVKMLVPVAEDLGDRWNAKGPGSVGNASYVWLPLVKDDSPVGFHMPALTGGGDGEWRVADY